ncbi:Thiol-disulfide isomerase or thioredoxin [bacterium A37T11]|nr:Thiol-disulfide isomerase or thioredoxin [bacterium A37T11]
MKKQIGINWLVVVILLLYSPFLWSQDNIDSVFNQAPPNIGLLKKKVEAHPDSLSYHEAYIKAAGLDSPAVIKQYTQWTLKFPKNAIVPFALGKAYEDQESPKAKPYLLKAVQLNPGLTEAWGGLWIDAERWGDFAGSRDYLKKAVASDSSNANYAFYYASSFNDVDSAKYYSMSLDVAKRFPNNERGAQALYWLGVRSKKKVDKLTYFKKLKDDFPPAKFRWSASGMNSYFDLLLPDAPEQALRLAQDMMQDTSNAKDWAKPLEWAQKFKEAGEFMQSGKPADALNILEAIRLPWYYKTSGELTLLMAKARDCMGQTQAAFDSLVSAFCKRPTVAIREAIRQYGKKLGQSSQQTDAYLIKHLLDQAEPATPFTLANYGKPGKTSLSEYQGKVVLLTYWFPGCGPCRGEFPHFEHVVCKFDKKLLAYIGINIEPSQNDYVVPFLKTSGYSFTALEEEKDRYKGNMDNRNAAPVNFLIDQKGNLIFSNFRTDGDNEEDLEMMIRMLLKI